MSDAAPSNARREATDVRFSMRTLLVATAVAAVGSLLFGMFLRQFPAHAQARLLVYWGILVASFAALFIRFARQRYRAEAEAGRVYLQLAPHSYFLPRAPRFLSLAVGVVLLALGPAMWVMGSFVVAEATQNDGWRVFAWYSFMAVSASAAGVTYLWWHRRIRVCEDGILVREELRRWPDCERLYWDASYRDVIVMEWKQRSRVAAHVPPEQREVVEALLREKIAT